MNDWRPIAAAAFALTAAIVLGLAVLLSGCEMKQRPHVAPRAPGPGEVCISTSYFDDLVAQQAKRDGWARVRMTAKEVAWFDGNQGSFERSGIRCWRDDADWMWCATTVWPNAGERQVLP